ncbi:Glucose/ribitol dehydrogenase [Penicillium italicum]|uniref:Glucose/ribitol dehydrogenase n=1 Tax=Penicillium italicum TaxID=40296 RepID=A0A0A2L1L9_PENIT|nr:Glucose/ribitol dehydrogenase [Penicillium italicum]
MVQATLTGQVGVIAGAGSANGIGRSIIIAAAKSDAKAIYACDINSSYFSGLQIAMKATGNDTAVECRIRDEKLNSIQQILKSCDRSDFYLANAGAKNSCNGLVRSGAVQLPSSNIRANAVAPGPATTIIFATSKLVEVGVEHTLGKTSEEIQDELAVIYRRFGVGKGQMYYSNRSAAPENIVNVAVSLTSDFVTAISGQVIVADGGKSVATSRETFIRPVPTIIPLVW